MTEHRPSHRTTTRTTTRPTPHYDAVVVGARVAGAATAMLAARAGLRVLVLDRARAGSDTLSTHALLRTGVLQLHRWGVLPTIVAAGTPAVRRSTFHLRSGDLPLDVPAEDGVDALYAPRRTLLDRTLATTAADAGADVRYGVVVTSLRRGADGRVSGVSGRDGAGRSFAVDADVVVGADGRRSLVAEQVAAPVQHRGSAALGYAYGYWTGVATSGYHWAFSTSGIAGLIPTDDGRTCVFVASPRDGGRVGRADFGRLLRRASPALAAAVEAGRPDGPVRTFPGAPALLRRAAGPGWALVGDAGYWKDPISAHGISDALRDAELLATALVAAAGGARPEDSFGVYQETRDQLSHELLAATEVVAAQRWDDQELGPLLRRLSAATTPQSQAVPA